MITQYRKKPVVIEAVIWDGKNFDDISRFTGDWHGHKLSHEDAEEQAIKTGLLYIKTPEGVMTANKGDYIIKGVKGEFYPCKPDIFLLTYEMI
jgi:hypothetical protein